MSVGNYAEDPVDDFLDRVRQLELKSTEEDLRRSQRLKSELLSSSTSPSRTEILLPKPVARSTFTPITNSPSINDFNSHVSADYRLSMENLAYQSAYNYDKSQKNSQIAKDQNNLNSLRDSHSFSSNSVRRSPTKRPEMPEVIKFDDFVSRTTTKPKSSRYSKFQITEEKKKEIDKTLDLLIGDGSGVDNNDADGNDESEIKSLTRDRKGGHLQSEWSTQTKSKLQRPTDIKPFSERSSFTVDIELSPRKENFNEEARTPKQSVETSPMKRSPGKLNISKFRESPAEPIRTKPEIKPKPQINSWFDSAKQKASSTSQSDLTSSKINILPAVRHSWMDSVREKTSSTPQGLSTASKLHIQPSAHGQNKWLDSVREKTDSTPQGLATDANYHVGTAHNQNSWLDSAKRNTPSSNFSADRGSKIKINRSDSSTLSQNISRREEQEKQRTAALRELAEAKLNHIPEPINESVPKNKEQDFNIEPVSLKKVRPSVPKKPNSISKPEFLDQNLSSIPSENSKRKVSVPEALKKSKSLRPPLPQRKPSLEVPEALKKSKSLKPPVPKQKPRIDVPEAFEAMGQLKPAKTRVVSAEKLPEGLTKLQSLKPSKPMRKPTPTELEAIAKLKNIKTKNPSTPAIKPKSARVTSQSKEILNSQLQRLKSVKETSTTEEPTNNKTVLKETLEKQLLRKAITDTNLLKSNHSPPTKQIQRASTFDSSDDTGKKLDHITKQRSKGPKRRVPRAVN